MGRRSRRPWLLVRRSAAAENQEQLAQAGEETERRAHQDQFQLVLLKARAQ